MTTIYEMYRKNIDALKQGRVICLDPEIRWSVPNVRILTKLSDNGLAQINRETQLWAIRWDIIVERLSNGIFIAGLGDTSMKILSEWHERRPF